jgi:stearoyl-CoA desaturase (delta-9 desaturase)
MTWYVIRGLQAVGLATNVKLPTERQKERLRIPKAA